ncbi:transposase [Allopontixanthobacter sp.]|uniref:transposase n=1 Tax=Allopontixanthobacter sp. TaxID=2906452 RepID=UPI002ABD0C47|nr:transposase [Allopontixanthobacter sp.]MDZ4308414.1 hypothetical protein [Allopontixanthobacter sp.]
MDQQSIIVSLEERAKLSGFTISAACTRAGIHPSTFFRWKKTERNPNPTGAPILTVEKLYKSVAEMEAEADIARQRMRAAGRKAVSA